MKYEHLMQPADWQELREIEQTVADARKRRAALFNRLRQRAYRERQGK